MLYGYNGGRRTFCKCLCDCGKDTVVSAEYLRDKRRKHHSCGCMTNYYKSEGNKRSELGHKFNRLTIITEEYVNGTCVATCVCECGKIIKVNRADVIIGHTKSCGCLQSENTSKTNLKDFTGMLSDSGVTFLNRYRKNEHGTWLWNCKCPLCGGEFIALPAKVLSNHTTSCGCKTVSSGERIIESFLKDIDVSYTKQKVFKDCKYHYGLPFDFAVYDTSNVLLFLIEYDGRQHFEPIEFFGGESGYKIQKIRDKIKDDFCKKNNIKLLRFSYLDKPQDIFKKITNTIYA